MEFLNLFDSKEPVTIDGTTYHLSRFLSPEMAAWSDEIRRKNADEATAHLTPDEKARFLQYFPSPPIDTADVARWATTPEGQDYVIDKQGKAAGIPDDVRAKLVKYGDPMLKRELAARLTRSAQTLAALGIDVEAEKRDGPLASPAGESGASPEIGAGTPPASTQPTAA